MKMNRIICILFVILLLGVIQSQAIDITATLSGGTPEGNIAVGANFYVNIEMYNDWGNVVGFSLPLYFYSSDGSIEAIEHRNVDGWSTYDWRAGSVTQWDSSIVFYNGWKDMWAQLFQFYSFGWDGTLPDTVNHTVAGIEGWYPSDTTKYFSYAFKINEVGIFCIDSCSIPDAGPQPGTFDWLFEDQNCNFNGPYCWNVVAYRTCGDLNDDGLVNITDITSLINHIYLDDDEIAFPGAGDVNADDLLNMLDIVVMINYVYGENTTLNCM